MILVGFWIGIDIIKILIIHGNNWGIQEKISSFFGGLTGSIDVDI